MDRNHVLAIPETERRALEVAFRDCESRMGRPATILEVCGALGLGLKELYDLLDQHRGIGLGCMDEFDSAAGETAQEHMVKYVPDPAYRDCFAVYSRSGFRVAMARALEALPRNEKLVVSLHHNEDMTMKEIAEIFGISEIRVAQIHTTAMLRIRGKLLSQEQV